MFSSVFAQQSWHEKVVTTCEKLDDNMKPSGEKLEYIEDYDVQGLKQFSQEKTKYYRDVAVGGLKKNLIVQSGSHQMDQFDSAISIGFTIDGTPIPPSLKLDSGDFILFGDVQKSKYENDYNRFSKPWNSWFLDKDDLSRKEGSYYEKQGVTVLYKRTDKALIIVDKYICYFNADKSTISWKEWKKFGVDISKLSDGDTDSKELNINESDRAEIDFQESEDDSSSNIDNHSAQER